MSELLLEILSEEIPSRFQGEIQDQFYYIIQKEFQKHSLVVQGLVVHIAPRRLVLSCQNITQGTVDSKRGPKTQANKGAIEGFARSCGVSVEELDSKKIKDVEYYFSPSVSTDVNITDSLCKHIERALLQISWPKSMYWNDSAVRWVRPVRNVMAVFDCKVLPLSFCGLKANNISYGHKIMSPESFVVKDFKQYQEQLFLKKVVLSQDRRKEIVTERIEFIASKLDVVPVQNNAVLDDVVGLVEYPVVRYGTIDKKFLSLPPEMIIKIMSAHQKFLALRNHDGSLAPYFITVLNVDMPDSEADIIAGNEKVLSARLYDGKFFFEEDVAVPLEERVDDLKKVIFHDQLGTLFTKVKRIEKVATYLTNFANVDTKQLIRAASLSKADLTTYMVNEFPEVQGIAGQYYAQYNGESDHVSRAIYEHYLPTGKDSNCPETQYGALISIADKIDTITGLFLINEVPTSSKDPYALRRCALGVIRIICKFSFDLNLKDLIKYSFGLYLKPCNDQHLSQVIDFIYERFRYWLKLHARDDLVSSALFSKSGFIYKEYKTLKFLEDAFEDKQLFFVFKRVNNLVKANNIEHDGINKKFITALEKQLLEEVVVLNSAIQEFYNNDTKGSLVAVLLDIEKTVGELFNDTMILDKNLDIREHRISILKKLDVASKKIADFSLIDL